MLQNNPAIRAKISQLWDKVWAGGIANPLTAIEQITYLLFMKQLDNLYYADVEKSEFAGERRFRIFDGYWIPLEYRNLPEAEQEKYQINKDDLRWSNVKRITSTDEMFTQMQTRVFPFIKELDGSSSAFTKHMANAVVIGFLYNIIFLMALESFFIPVSIFSSFELEKFNLNDRSPPPST
jgi:type I restriction enzyme M protein